MIEAYSAAAFRAADSQTCEARVHKGVLFDTYQWEVDPGKIVLDAAKRALLEEGGYGAKELVL